MKSCASCRYWEPTEIDLIAVGTQPHHAREIATQQEMMRATSALCAWPAAHAFAKAFFAACPPWVQRSHAASGTLTDENDGSDCPCWQQRDDIEIGRG